MKLIKFEDAKVKKANHNTSDPYIQVDPRKSSLIGVEDLNDNSYYLVTNPEEKKELRDALANTFPILTEEEINKMLGIDS